MGSERFWNRAAGGFTDQEKGIDLSQNMDYVTLLKYLKPDDTVLDYGCATGIISNAIADKVKEVYAFDISSKMIEVAKQKALDRQITNVHYTQAAMIDDRYQAESFNVILSFRVLHVLEDIPAVMNSINALLKPGGIFISVTTCMGAYKIIGKTITTPLKKMGILPHLNWFTLSSLQSAMTEGGFEIVESEKMDDQMLCYCVVARKP